MKKFQRKVTEIPGPNERWPVREVKDDVPNYPHGAGCRRYLVGELELYTRRYWNRKTGRSEPKPIPGLQRAKYRVIRLFSACLGMSRFPQMTLRRIKNYFRGTPAHMKLRVLQLMPLEEFQREILRGVKAHHQPVPEPFERDVPLRQDPAPHRKREKRGRTVWRRR